MKRRTFLIGLVVLGIIVAGVLFLDPTRSLLGWVSGETFFKDRPSSYWAKKLAQTDPATRTDAIQTITDAKAEALPLLMELLSRKDSQESVAELRLTTIDLLGKLGGDAKPAVSSLISLLKDSDPHIRTVSGKSLLLIGDPPPEALPIFIEMLNTPEKLIAAKALSNYKAQAKEAIPALTKLLRDPDIDVRWNASKTLGKIGPDSKVSIAEIVAQLQDEQALVREHAAEALGDIGLDAAIAIPELVRVLTDPDTRVRRDAIRSLGQVGPDAKKFIPEMLPLIDDPAQIVREAALKTIRTLDPNIPLKEKE